MPLSNYSEIINDQSISLAKMSFSQTQSMLYLYLCNRNNISKILNGYIFHSPIITVPAALIQLQVSLFLKEGSRAGGKAREGRRQTRRERSHLPPAGAVLGGRGGEEEEEGQHQSAAPLGADLSTSSGRGEGKEGEMEDGERLREGDKSLGHLSPASFQDAG